MINLLHTSKITTQRYKNNDIRRALCRCLHCDHPSNLMKQQNISTTDHFFMSFHLHSCLRYQCRYIANVNKALILLSRYYLCIKFITHAFFKLDAPWRLIWVSNIQGSSPWTPHDRQLEPFILHLNIIFSNSLSLMFQLSIVSFYFLIRNELYPGLNRDYSILDLADSIKTLNNNGTFQYMLDANSRRHWGGIFEAPTSYRLISCDKCFP